MCIWHNIKIRYKQNEERCEIVLTITSGAKRKILSMYMMTIDLSIISLKMASIIDWKVAGELHIPKNITVGLNSPLLVLKAAFHWSPS